MTKAGKESEREKQWRGDRGEGDSQQFSCVTQARSSCHATPESEPAQEPLCHTLFRERGNETFILVPRMFKSHV
jgi:hypothetical protein